MLPVWDIILTPVLDQPGGGSIWHWVNVTPLHFDVDGEIVDLLTLTLT